MELYALHPFPVRSVRCDLSTINRIIHKESDIQQSATTAGLKCKRKHSGKHALVENAVYFYTCNNIVLVMQYWIVPYC